MKAFINLAVTSGFVSVVVQAMFWIIRSQSTLEPQISWIGSYGVATCSLLLLATARTVLAAK